MKNTTNYGCEGLKALISGGTSGIGLATARLLLESGAEVVITGRSLKKAQLALEQLEQSTGKKALYIPCDVTRPERCREVMLKIGGTEGRKDWKLDILVLSAGVYKEQTLEHMTEADYDKLMNVNVKGTMLMIQAALPYLNEGSSLITVASDAGLSGNYGCPLYCASKGAVIALTRALALDLAPKTRVNCVCPGDVATPLLDKQLLLAEGAYSLKDMESNYPLGRVARPEEVAHVICSLASPANSFMTGSIVAVDGGLTAR